MGKFFVRFSDLLTPIERERLDELNENGIPQHIRDEINNTGDEYWKKFKLANYIAVRLCFDEPFERQQEVTALLEINQKKSRRMKLLRGVGGILLWFAVLCAVIKFVIWLF